MFQLKSLPRTLDAALRDVNDPKPKVRRSALADLARWAAESGPGVDRSRAVSALATVLQQDDQVDVRAQAAVALADAQATEQLPALWVAIEDAHESVRQMALMALGELSPPGEERTVALLDHMLCASGAPMRFQALLAAHRVGVEAWEAKLEAATRDPDGSVRYLAFRLLEQRHAAGELPESVLDRATRALTDPDASVAVAAAMLAAPRGSAAGCRVLEDAICRGVRLPAPEDEQALVELAGELGLTRAVPGLRRMAFGRFGFSPGPFGWQAKVALARLGDAAARKDIRRGLSSRDATLVHLAVVAVGRARWSDMAPTLLELRASGRVGVEVVDEALALLQPAASAPADESPATDRSSSPRGS